MHVKLYEDIARYGHIATSYDYPVLVNGRYLASPSPIPKFDNPKLDMNPALLLFGAGRENGCTRSRRTPGWKAWPSTTIRSRRSAGNRLARYAAPTTAIWTKSSPTTPARANTSAPTATTASNAATHRKARNESAPTQRPRPRQGLRQRQWLLRRRFRALLRRSAVRGRRIRLRQIHAAGRAGRQAGRRRRQRASATATAASTNSPPSPNPSAAGWRAANGASCPSTPATACAWTSPPAPISASG